MAESDEWNEINGCVDAHNRRFFPHPEKLLLWMQGKSSKSSGCKNQQHHTNLVVNLKSRQAR